MHQQHEIYASLNIRKRLGFYFLAKVFYVSNAYVTSFSNCGVHPRMRLTYFERDATYI